MLGLDLENRYWQYMSTHPAHASLPQTAYEEALEVLTWCYAGELSTSSFPIKSSFYIDQVLQTPQPLPVPAPFSQKECADLLELLRNVTGSCFTYDCKLIVDHFPASSNSSNHVVRTRLIAQILLHYSM